MFAAAHQRQELGPRVGQVTRDVQEVLEAPDASDGDGRGLAPQPERPDDEQGHEQLHEGAAENGQRLPSEDPEQRVPGLVEEQVRSIQQRDPARLQGQSRQAEEDQARGDTHHGWRPDGLPIRVPGILEGGGKRDHGWAWCLATIQSTTWSRLMSLESSSTASAALSRGAMARLRSARSRR